MPGDAARVGSWELLNTVETVSRLTELIKQAKDRLVLISPYLDLAGEDRIGQEIRAALKRKVKVSIVVRRDARRTLDPAWRAAMQAHVAGGLLLYEVPWLHAKVYYSESAAIVASLNLLKSSVIGSIEVGLYSRDPVALRHVNSLVAQEIKPHSNPLDLDKLNGQTPDSDKSQSPSKRDAPARRRRYAALAASHAFKFEPDEEAEDDDSEEDDDADVCFRCGRPGHWAEDCYARTTVDGEELDDDDDDDF